MAAPGLTRVAVYRRRLAAGEARVWENVRDWEHLPWLHRTSFRSIALEDEGDWGWRARVGLHPAPAEIRLELVFESSEAAPARASDPPVPTLPRRYVARTLDGPGAGGEIWTRVEPLGPDATAVEVEFWLPGVAAAQAEALGAAYVRLYTRLWDEDEAMMARRAERLAQRPAPRTGAPAPLELGPLESLRPRLPLRVGWGGASWRLVEHDGALFLHSTVCPHRLGPLEEAPIEEGCVVCPWHGYRFGLRTGRSADGRLRLPPPPRVEVVAGGVVRLVSGAPAREATPPAAGRSAPG